MQVRILEQHIKLQTIVHGSRRAFTHFDEAFVGSNSGNKYSAGFYFFDSLDSAAYHAFNHCKEPGQALLYVCRFCCKANILLRGQPISYHSAAVQSLWKRLPQSAQALVEAANWFDLLYQAAADNLNDKLALLHVSRMLRQAGFDAIYNMPVHNAHPAFESTEILLMDPEAIEIIFVLDAHTRGEVTLEDKGKIFA